MSKLNMAYQVLKDLEETIKNSSIDGQYGSVAIKFNLAYHSKVYLAIQEIEAIKKEEENDNK